MSTIPKIREEYHALARKLRQHGADYKEELNAMAARIAELAEETKRKRRPKAPGKRCPISPTMKARIIAIRANRPTWTIHQITEHFGLRNNRAVHDVIYGKRT